MTVLASGNMEVSTKLGSAQGCAVRAGALKTGRQYKIKKRLGRLFSCLLLFGRSKRSKVADKGERPTMKVTPKAHKRRLTKNQCSIYSPSRAKVQQKKLNQALTSEGLQRTNAASSRRA
jgi:hypothetical protein